MPVNQNAVAFIAIFPFGKQVVILTAETFANGRAGFGISPVPEQ